MHTLDVFFIALTAIIAYRLYIILGHRGDQASSSSDTTDEQRRTKERSVKTPSKSSGKDGVSLMTALKQIEYADKTFSQDYFLQGAEKAFEMIIQAFIKGDKETLEELVSSKLLKKFSQVIDQRNTEERMGELLYFRVAKVEMKNVTVKNGTAFIQVMFESEQTQVLKDKNGNLIEGDPDSIDHIAEIWTFERPLDAKTPHWLLAETSAVS